MGLGIQAGATTYVLQPDGSGDFPTIQEAVDHTLSLDTILLAPGVYRGDGNRDVVLPIRPITIGSLERDATTCLICPDGSEVDPHRAFCVYDGLIGETRIQELTILGGNTIQNNMGVGGAIHIVEASNTYIVRCVFISNRSDYGGAISVGNYATPLITECIFMENHAREAGGALDITGHANATVRHCTFWENSTAGYSGAVNCEYGSMLMEFCTIVKNWGADLGAVGVYQTAADIEATIIAFSHGSYGLITENASVNLECTDIFGNDRGDWVSPFAYQLGQNGNICADPLFCNLAVLDFNLNADSPCRPPSDEPVTCTWMGAWWEDCEDAAGLEPSARDASAPRIESVAPNPFRASTQLSLTACPGARAELCIYDPSGRLVRVLAAGASERVLTWDGRSQSGERVPPGMYVCQLRAGTALSQEKLVLVR